MNNKKLFIIDGMALIYRSYYAMIKNPLLSSSGLNTSAIYGFINSLFKLLKDEKPDYLSIVLDTKVAPAPSARVNGLKGRSKEPIGVDLVTLPTSEVGEY